MVLNALAWASRAGDASGLGRAAIRLIGALVLAYGLWRAARWAWWFAVVFSALLSALGAIGLAAVARGPILEGRPNPALDVAFFAGSTVALAAALVLLLLPAARRAVNAVRPPG